MINVVVGLALLIEIIWLYLPNCEKSEGWWHSFWVSATGVVSALALINLGIGFVILLGA